MCYLDRYLPSRIVATTSARRLRGERRVNGPNALDGTRSSALNLWFEHKSLELDLKILALTVWKALKRERIIRPGRATTGEFGGILGRPEALLGGTLAAEAVYG